MKIYNKKGTSILLTILIMGALFAVAIGVSRLAVGELKLGRDITKSLAAYYAAESGIEQALYVDYQGSGENFTGCLDSPEGELCYEVTFDEGCSARVITSNGSYKDTRRAIELTKAGAFQENLFTDGCLEDWDDESNLTNWYKDEWGSSTVNREDSDIHSGSYSCRLDIDSDNTTARIYQYLQLTPNTNYILSFWYKVSIPGRNPAIYFYETWNYSAFLLEDGTWTSEDTSIWLPEAVVWTEYTISFTTPDTSYTDYTFVFFRDYAADASLYVDDISLTLAP